MGKRTWRWWVVRFELGLGIVAFLFTASVVVFVVAEPCFGCNGGPELLIASLAALLVMLFGLLWMIRIIRGPRDEPPPWRSRGG